MAELLIKWGWGGDPLNQSAWRRGYIVQVSEDGYLSNYGGDIKLPHFLVVRITDMSVQEAQEYASVDIEFPGGIPVEVGIRRWKFDVDDPTIPSQIKNDIINKGYIAVTRSQVINFFKRTR